MKEGERVKGEIKGESEKRDRGREGRGESEIKDEERGGRKDGGRREERE